MEEFKFGESYQEKPQEANQAPKMENYNPNDGLGQPGVDPNNIPQPQFLDLNNPQNFSNVGNNPQQQQPYMPQYQVPQQPTGPNFEGIKDKAGMGSKINSIMEMGDKIDVDVNTGDSAVNSGKYGITKAVSSLHEAIKMLKDIDYWIPKGKEEYAPQLKKISQPITKALEAYVSKVESLS